ncbi:Protein SRX-2 [Aphelenchoides avenae]|nr:Protein SRX-2 [Aphelenchus avenae]
MVLRTASIIIGVAVGVASIGTFLCSVVVLYVLLRSGFMRHQHGSFYVLVFANVLVDAVTAAIFGFYMTPSIFLQDWLFPGGTSNSLNKLVGIVGHMCQYQAITSQIVMALNR